MPSCWEEAISALYIGVTGRFRLTYEDRALEAEEKLDKLLRQLERREQTLGDTRAKHRAEALSLRHDRVRARNKVLDLKRATAELQRITSYRETVLQHMDALKNTELNKSLIQTLSESSRTLRDLGVMDGVRQAEAVVQDVEASMMQVQELTSVLAAPMPSMMELSGTYSNEDLDEELDRLLNDEDLGVGQGDLAGSSAATGGESEAGPRSRKGTRDALLREPHSISSFQDQDTVGGGGGSRAGHRVAGEKEETEDDDDDGMSGKKSRAISSRLGVVQLSETIGLL